MLASEHNIHFMKRFVDDIRTSIMADRFTEFKKDFLKNYAG